MDLVELYAVPDTFADGVGRVDILGGGFARFVLYVRRRLENGTVANVIVASNVVPLSSIAASRAVTDEAIKTGEVIGGANDDIAAPGLH